MQSVFYDPVSKPKHLHNTQYIFNVCFSNARSQDVPLCSGSAMQISMMLQRHLNEINDDHGLCFVFAFKCRKIDYFLGLEMVLQLFSFILVSVMKLQYCVCVCVCFWRGEGGIIRCRICHGDICVPRRSSRGPLHLRNLQLSALTPFRPPLVSTTRPACLKGGVYERKRVRKIERGREGGG